MRACWNRQTGTFEGRVSTDVWVQVPLLAPAFFIAGLCKGSTADSDSVCLGSNPSPAARKKTILRNSLFLHKTKEIRYFVTQKTIFIYKYTAVYNCFSSGGQSDNPEEGVVINLSPGQRSGAFAVNIED